MGRRRRAFEVEVGRPEISGSNGVSEGGDPVLSWGPVGERISLACDFWLAIAGPDGWQHAVSVWGVEDRLLFGGERSTWKAGNPAANRNMVARPERVAEEGAAADPPRYRYASILTARPETASAMERRCGCSTRVLHARGRFHVGATRRVFGGGSGVQRGSGEQRASGRPATASGRVVRLGRGDGAGGTN